MSPSHAGYKSSSPITRDSSPRENKAAVSRREDAGQVRAAEVLSRGPEVHISHGHTEEVLVIILM